jgi:hypothetical protein
MEFTKSEPFGDEIQVGFNNEKVRLFTEAKDLYG